MFIMLRANHALLVIVLGFAGLLTQPALADSGLLQGSLGQWLDESAAPKLGEILSRHPKFKGETVRFVSLRNGKPMASGNLLTQAIEQRLTQRLLRREGVRLSWQDDPEMCAAPARVPYLLGLEMQRNGSRNHQLNIAMVDVEEGVWVSGVSLSWEGRLSSAERAALASEVASGAEGSTENPLKVQQRTQISEIMRAGLQCSLPRGLDGPLFIKTPAQADLAAIAQSLTRALSVTPLAAITPDRADAEWVMKLTARTLGTGSQEVVVTLQDTTSDEIVQQVASVFVTGLDLSADVDPRTIIAEQTPVGKQPSIVSSPLQLLTPLIVRDAERNGICDAAKARANSCVEVGFELLRPAYLLVLSTQDQRLRSQACGRNLQLADPGERRYRLRIPPTPHAATQADAGLYVVAVENRALAHRIARHLNRGPGACASVGGDQTLAVWLRGLDDLLQQHELEIDWRATHLRHSATGIVRL
jgi:hypothetical protein